MTTTEMHPVTIMIGNGTKRHRGFATKVETDPGKPWNRIRYQRVNFCCSCPNTVNGHARHAARIVADGWINVDCGKRD